MEYQRDEHRVHLIVYHLIWTPKRGKITVSAADVVKECKGVTSRTLRKKHPHLLKLPSMWTRSYFASTAGNVSAETIK
ncbi:MAG: IS200/IS605 family transposase, partial [Chloroflexi bacterium]|nr:IS200/IS605 family transposase [Chloroflexota bacterium]